MPPEPTPLSGLLPPDAQWTPVNHGESGATVLRDARGQRYAKVVPLDRAAELRAERERIEWLSGTGICGPTVLDWRTSSLGVSLMTGAVPGVPAHALDPARLRTAWPSMVDLVRALHSVPVASCPYRWTVDGMMQIARRTVALDRVHTEFLPERLRHTPPAEILDGLEQELPRRREQEAADEVVCHADLCLPNVIVDPETLQASGLIDLGRLGRSDPYVDIALFLGNARASWPDSDTARRADDEFGDRYGITLDHARRDFYLRLDPLTW